MKVLYVLHVLTSLCFVHACLCEIYGSNLEDSNFGSFSTSVDDDINSDIHKLKCDSIFSNLLRVKYEQTLPASAFIREFFETVRCDDVFNMTFHRLKFAAKINLGDKSRMHRVLNFVSNETDELVVAQVVFRRIISFSMCLIVLSFFVGCSSLSWLARGTIGFCAAIQFSIEILPFHQIRAYISYFWRSWCCYGNFQAALKSFRYIKHNMEMKCALHVSCCISVNGSSPWTYSVSWHCETTPLCCPVEGHQGRGRACVLVDVGSEGMLCPDLYVFNI